MTPALPRSSTDSPSTALPATPFDPVGAFMAEHGADAVLQRAIALIGECLFPAGEVRLEVESDPETAERWVAITTPVRGTTDELLERNRRFKEQWIRSAPDSERRLLRFSYDVL